MTAVVILNIVFAVFVVGGMATWLSRAIVVDKQDPRPVRRSRRPLALNSRPARQRPSGSRRADRVAAGV
jgi:hypothetical protein